jgi:hypothetical protein
MKMPCTFLLEAKFLCDSGKLATPALHYASKTLHLDILGLTAKSSVWAECLASLAIDYARVNLAESRLHAANTFEILALGNCTPDICKIGG